MFNFCAIPQVRGVVVLASSGGGGVRCGVEV